MSKTSKPHDTDIAEFLELLVLEHSDTVFHVFMRVLYAWMEECDRTVLRADIAERVASLDEEGKKKWAAIDPRSTGFEERTMKAMFQARVSAIVEAKQYQRREIPLDSELKGFDHGQRIDPIADKIQAHIRGWAFNDVLNFLAELTGAWMLSCPEAIIRAHPVFIKNDAHWVKTDADLTLVLIRWLHRALW